MFFNDVLIPLGIMFIIFYFTYLIIKVLAHRKERQMMVEKMAQNPDIMNYKLENQIEIVKNPYNWIKPAGLVIGLGIGCLIVVLGYANGWFDVMSDGMGAILLFGFLLIFGGLGMFGGFFMERGLRKSDKKDK